MIDSLKPVFSTEQIGSINLNSEYSAHYTPTDLAQHETERYRLIDL